MDLFAETSFIVSDSPCLVGRRAGSLIPFTLGAGLASIDSSDRTPCLQFLDSTGSGNFYKS